MNIHDKEELKMINLICKNCEGDPAICGGFQMDGTWHCEYNNCCKRDKLCKPCNGFIAPSGDSSLHYQPIYEGYFYQCGICKEVTT